MQHNAKLVVCQPVVDLRSKPIHLKRKDFSLNQDLLTQLLYNEELELISQEDDWIFVKALEQEHYTKSWHFYRGWIHKTEVTEVKEFTKKTHVVCIPSSHFSFGTKVNENEAPSAFIRPLKIKDRKTLISDARQFIGSPYLWGGRSSLSQTFYGSVDCSGFIDLLYRAQGICIPRDAEPQRKKCVKIQKKDLLPGDLIYLSRVENPEKATHVLLYNGKTFIEAPSTGKNVQELEFEGHYLEKEDYINLKGRDGDYLPTYGRFV